MGSATELSPRNADDLLGKLQMVPNHLRRFNMPEASATTVFRLSPDLVAKVTAAGLAHRSPTGELFFDYNDLLNLSLDLQTPSTWTVGMKFWCRALEAGGPIRECKVGYVFSCPDAGHPSPCRVEVLTPDRGWVRQDVTEQAAPVRLASVSEFRLCNEWPDLPPDVLALVEEVGKLEFKRLPANLGLRSDFVSRTGLVDCRGAAWMLINEARRRGVPARHSVGLVVVPPFSSLHNWMDFLVDGVWIPVDPVMIGALIRWGLLSSERWHVGRSIGGILGRLSDATPLARHNGKQFSISLPTESFAGSATA